MATLGVRISNLIALTTLADADLFLKVDISAGADGSKKLTWADLKTNIVEQVDADQFVIDFLPSNFTPDDSIAEADNVNQIAAFMKGIDNQFGMGAMLHASSHEDGGTDEINVAGLSGLLADSQTPLNHAITHTGSGTDLIDGDRVKITWVPTAIVPNTTPPEAFSDDDLTAILAGIDDFIAAGVVPLHAGTHGFLGTDPINVQSIPGVLAERQHPKLHASDHWENGTDEILVEKLGTANVDTARFLKPDGLGGLEFGIPTHVPEPHAASHQDGGSDEINVGGLSGLLADAQTPLAHTHTHASTTGQTPNDHHNKLHGSDHWDGASDEIELERLATAETDADKRLAPTGSGGVEWVDDLGLPDNIVTTVNAVDTTIATIPLDDNTVYLIETYTEGRRTDAAGRGGFVRRAVFYRESGGVATQQGGTQTDFTRRSNGNYNSLMVVSGNNVLIQVTGQTGHTINWKSSHLLKSVG